jgi:DNA mismatch repair protein MutS
VEFHSILFRDTADSGRVDRAVAPECFVDLNLDQIVAAITAGREEYNLKPFFYLPLQDLDAIAFRHEVMHDLADPELFDNIRAFTQAMRQVREHLALSDKVRHPLQQQRWFLEATAAYCHATLRLVSDLSKAELGSRGMLGFRAYVSGYVADENFESLRRSAEDLVARLASIEYGVLIQDTRVDVRQYEGEPDYSAQVLATFARFRQGAAQGYKFDFADPPEVNHIEGQILDRMALLNAPAFTKLSAHFATRRDFPAPTILRFDREVQFYIAYIEHMARFEGKALHFCYPQVTATRAEIYNDEGFDLALANALLAPDATPVCNDFRLASPERIIVVSGPNQGGKTTFARTFGQLHYLASLGCPVPGRRAQLYLFDRIFTHFERSEQMVSLRGKLQDDLIRVNKILTAATPRSIIIMNEIFTSTTLRDAISLSHKIAGTIIDLDLYCVWVSFIDELSALGETTVSMVSTVIPGNPTQRTFQIVRRPADGLAYAISIAEKYRLTYDMIRQRVA